MEYLPIFVDIKSKPVLVLGGGNIAARKISLLICAGAQIKIVAKKICSKLKKKPFKGKILWLGKNFETYMLDNVFLVIIATNNDKLNIKILQYAEKYNILANVVDNKLYCSFIFPSIVNRNPIVIGISSGGTSPVLIRILREKFESILPKFIGTIAKILGIWRNKVKIYIDNMIKRRRFWEKLLNGQFSSLVAKGKLKEAEQLLKKELYIKSENKGEVILIGAGPGNRELLTLRGLQLIQQADVVLYDYLVSKDIIDLIRRDADIIFVGKHAGKFSINQNEINNLLLKLAKQGKRVIRLKGGDPFVFGRGGEELQFLSSKGIPFQVVPGITSAIGSAAYAGIPLTHRDYSQSITFITGNSCIDNNNLNWNLFAANNHTLVIYMGIFQAKKIKKKLIFYGKSLNTPIAIVSNGTRINQNVKIDILDNLDKLAKKSPSPSLIIIGEVVNIHHEINWFEYQNMK